MGSILEAPLGLNASFIWRSILWRRELFMKGFRWRIGDGGTTRIYENNRLSIPYGFHVSSPRSLPNNSLVSMLLKPDGGWDIDFVKAYFFAHEAAMILAIPQPRFPILTLVAGTLTLKGFLLGQECLFCGSPFVPQLIYEWACAYYDGFIHAHATSVDVRKQADVPCRWWLAPVSGHLKMNVDDVFNSFACGLEFVLRDSSGACMVAGAFPISSTRTVVLGELEAIRQGLILALECGLYGFSVETDCLGAIASINGIASLMDESGVLVQDIQHLSYMAHVSSLRFLPRNSNMVAHFIACFALHAGVELVWLEDEVPLWLHDLLIRDSMS
ncbi:conserved hypothetical protein [Ricinus communis]|uniref:RNase H type-1 domain-containing protein n=1 Tax=Ricinus communis TaxID=3988 RepID=B9SJC2_RICCO|nr:conserved hypothetical protein [Ricinus communis]